MSPSVYADCVNGNYSRNLTVKVWANLDNPIKSYDFSKLWLMSCMPQWRKSEADHGVGGGGGGTPTLFFPTSTFSLFFLVRYVRAKMIVHAFMIELDQLVYWCPRQIKNGENLCTKSLESYFVVVSQILAEWPSRRSDIGIQTKFCEIITLNPFSTGTGWTLYKVYGGFRFSYGTG